MTDRVDELVKYLRLCCVRIDGVRPGTGFFISPDVIVTCGHVTGPLARGANINFRFWSKSGRLGTPEPATVLGIFPDDDLAFIRTSVQNKSAVELSEQVSIGDQIIGVGFPQREVGDERDIFTTTYEGKTEFYRGDHNVGSEIKLKSGQIEPGFSGGPLLNTRTYSVIGVTAATRDRTSDLGGWGVEVATLLRRARQLELELTQINSEWASRAARARPTHVGLHLVPPLPPYFVERPAALKEVLERLFTKGEPRNFAISALHGFGGIGKSTLAIAAARTEHALQYCPDGVLWVSLGQDPQILPLLSSWLEAIGAGTPTYWSIEAAVALLRTALHDRALLLVVDDVWDPEHAKPFIVGGPDCCVLMTTRRASVADLLGADTWVLDAMTAGESVQLMSRRARNLVFDANFKFRAERLADRLGNLPLAVEMVGALLNRNLSISHIDTQISALVSSSANRASTVSAAIDACLQLSLNYLKRDQPEVWRRFLFLCLTPARTEIFSDAWAMLWAVPQSEAESILCQLADEAMISRYQCGYRLHDLMSTVAARTIEASEPIGLGITHRQAYQEIVNNLRKKVHKGRWDQLPRASRIHTLVFPCLLKAGDFDVLDEVILQTTADGRNAWYVGCEERGEVPIFVNDLQSAIESVALERPDRIDLQIRFALIIASLNSFYTHLTEDLLKGLVGGGAWSVAEAYHWCGAFANASNRPAFLIALLEGIAEIDKTKIFDADLVERVAQSAYVDTSTLLMERAPNKNTAKLTGRLIATLPSDRQKTELIRHLETFVDPEARLALVGDVDRSILGSIPTEIYHDIKCDDVSYDQIAQMCRLVHYIDELRQEELCDFIVDKLTILMDPSQSSGESIDDAPPSDDFESASFLSKSSSHFADLQNGLKQTAPIESPLSTPDRAESDKHVLAIGYHKAEDGAPVIGKTKESSEAGIAQASFLTRLGTSIVSHFGLGALNGIISSKSVVSLGEAEQSSTAATRNFQLREENYERNSADSRYTANEVQGNLMPERMPAGWGDPDFVDALVNATTFFSEHALVRLKALSTLVASDSEKLRLKLQIEHTLSLIEKETISPSGKDAGIYANFTQASPQNIASCFSLFCTGSVLEAKITFQDYILNSWKDNELHSELNVEFTCVAWLRYWRRLGSAGRRASAEVLASLGPDAVGPKALLLACDGSSAQKVRALIEEIKSLPSYLRRDAIRTCVSIGIADLANDILVRIVPIDDVEEQAAAVYSVMPYLPVDFPRDLLAPWRRQDLKNKQITGLTDMMVELVRALDLDDLSEVVVAASGLHSEWWIVEACTLMLRRLSEIKDFEAVLRASQCLENRDLRARLVGRVAQRAADYHHTAFALNAVQALPAGPLRSDELRSLANTFFILGQVRGAIDASCAIPDADLRDQVLTDGLMELCAQQEIKQARDVLSAVASKKWVDRGLAIISSVEMTPKQSLQPDIVRIRVQKRQEDVGLLSSSLLAKVPEQLLESGIEHPSITDLSLAIATADRASMIEASRCILMEPNSQGVRMAKVLAGKTRSEALLEIKYIAPLFAYDQTGIIPSKVISAIGDVGRWWR